MATTIERLVYELSVVGQNEVDRALNHVNTALENSTKRMRFLNSQQIADLKGMEKQYRAFEKTVNDAMAVMSDPKWSPNKRWFQQGGEFYWKGIGNAITGHGKVAKGEVEKAIQASWESLAGPSMKGMMFLRDKMQRQAGMLMDGLKDSLTKGSQSTQGAFSKLFFGPGKGGLLSRVMTGSGFGSMFMRWAALTKVMEGMDYLSGDLLMGRKLASIGKKQFALGSLDFTPSQMRAAEVQARAISAQLGGQVSTTDIMEAISEAGSAHDVNKVGVGGLASFAKYGAQMGLLGKMDPAQATKLIAKLQQGFQNTPEMSGLSVDEQAGKIARIVTSITSKHSLAWGPDVGQFMKHAQGTALFRGMDLASSLAFLGVMSNVGYHPGQIGRSFRHMFGPKGEEDFARLLLAGDESGNLLPELSKRGNQVKAKQLVREKMKNFDYSELLQDEEKFGNVALKALTRALSRGTLVQDIFPSKEWSPQQMQFINMMQEQWLAVMKSAREEQQDRAMMEKKLHGPMSTTANQYTALTTAMGRFSESLANVMALGGAMGALAERLNGWSFKLDARSIIKEAKSWKDLEEGLWSPEARKAGIKAYGSRQAYAAYLKDMLYSERPDLISDQHFDIQTAGRAFRAWGYSDKENWRYQLLSRAMRERYGFLSRGVEWGKGVPDRSIEYQAAMNDVERALGPVVASRLRNMSDVDIHNFFNQVKVDDMVKAAGGDPLKTDPSALGLYISPEEQKRIDSYAETAAASTNVQAFSKACEDGAPAVQSFIGALWKAITESPQNNSRSEGTTAPNSVKSFSNKFHRL